jgi:hypothetical protein
MSISASSHATDGSSSGNGRYYATSGIGCGAWGRERHEAALRDEAILRDLKEDHLRELGLPLGARIKLLKAIAALPQGKQT